MRLAAAIVVITALCRIALADSQPWSAGVSAEQQARANAIFAQGNELFAREQHAPALEKYRAAIALWDHPMIRFNMAVTQIRLDRILEAAVDLERALRFGQQPFTRELYQQALDYQRLVGKQVATVEVSCDQPETQIVLDGKPWFTCPGRRSEKVLAGEHVVVGERVGYVPASRRIVVRGGEVADVRLELVTIESVTKVEYPVARWIPWSTAAGGAAVALIGVAVLAAGHGQMDTFDARFATACANGCRDDLSDQPALADELASARFKNRLGVSLIVVGVAAAAGGVGWALIKNKPRRVVPTVDVSTSGGFAATATWSF